MKRFVVLFLLLVQYNIYAQDTFQYEKAPVFPNCETIEIDSLQQCFDTNVFTHVYENFKVPQKVLDENYKGNVAVLFEVDTTGLFKVIYIDAIYKELKDETKRVFGLSLIHI